MTDRDYDRFCEQFDLLAVTHRLMASEDLRAKMKAEYFDILRPYPMPAIETAYQTLRRRTRKWPVPVDWLEAMPASHWLMRLPPLTDEEMRLVREAERLAYERDECCTCTICQHAGTTHLRSRYVPQLDAQGELIRRRDPSRPEPVILGRWLHGQELRAWYQARGVFLLAYHELCERVERQQRMAPKTLEERLTRLETAAKVASIE